MNSEHNKTEAVKAFIERWANSGAAERANAQSFISELCQIIEVEPPQPKTPDEVENAYVFEKTIPGATGNKNFIDCYKRGFFVLEAKQGANDLEGEVFSESGKQQKRKRKTGHGRRGTKGWDTAMKKAHKQAENYLRRLPKEEIGNGRPPFLMVTDVGYTIEIYSDWSRAGGHYVAFPDPASFRIPLNDLAKKEVRELLHSIWTDPLSLDPSRRSARVTKQIADSLAKLARSLEAKHEAEEVAGFLMRCLFTMFAEDVELLPDRSFTELLQELKGEPENFAPMLESLWTGMNEGGFSPIIRKKLPRFNGGLFSDQKAIPLNPDQIQLLVEAASADWKDVEPAIFGTLLERALNPKERHKLGAHYTPRAYVERLVQPTVIQPLRAEWEATQVAALQLAEEGDTEKAIKEIESYLKRLANIKVLDPACGSGNFLYVTLELLKRIEGEVLNTLQELGQGQLSLELAGVMVTPANLLGIEINPRAAKIAELVLWIGFLQWHLRTRGNLQSLPEPIIRDLNNVECRDAVLEWDDKTPMIDKEGHTVTRWDGRTTITHNVTGEQVPDPNARVQAYKYHNPRKAEWPKSDFIVGNPPFIGTARMREALGDGYTEALRKTYENVPDSADFVMYWWDQSAEKVASGILRSFGLITTNSLSQTFNRRVIQNYLGRVKPLYLAFAIPDHPWVDAIDGADVRIAMTVATRDYVNGRLLNIVKEERLNDNDTAKIIFSTKTGRIFADLKIGANVAGAVQLSSNKDLSFKGMMLTGKDFIISQEQSKVFDASNNTGNKKIIKPYITGRDITQNNRKLLVIDAFGLSSEELFERNPVVFQWLWDRVKPEREAKISKTKDSQEYAKYWWLFSKPRIAFRKAIKDLEYFFVTARTAKHRFFIQLDKPTIIESGVIGFAFSDFYYLGILSSRIHTTWSNSAGGKLGVGNDPVYTNTRCFNTFPFPISSEKQMDIIRELANRLDFHRKRQQELYPNLTMTNMYNVLEKERKGETLIKKEKTVHNQGLISVLRQIHTELDEAVANSYGWTANLSEDEILERLVQLNAERAAEEAQGHIRWLRPEYQAPETVQTGVQGKLLEVASSTPKVASREKRNWPEKLAGQAAAIRDVLLEQDSPIDVKTLAALFDKKNTQKKLDTIQRILETLEALGQAESEGELWRG